MTGSEGTPPQKSLRILLIGESCVDEYRTGVCRRLSPEAPVPILEHWVTAKSLGMARNVESNLQALGADVTIITNNADKIIKRRFMDKISGQVILREDEESHVPVANLSGLDTSPYDAIVISDYDKGLIYGPHIVGLRKHFKGPIYVDTKSQDVAHYAGCIVKMNFDESQRAMNIPDDCELIVTLGSEGALGPDGKNYDAPLVDVFDVTGAGDVFLAALAYFDVMYEDLDLAIRQAISLASMSVSHRGTYTITQEDIRDSYKQF